MLALCLTNYNRFELLIDSFTNVINDPRIAEIVISDDHSDPVLFEKLSLFCYDKPKIKLFRNQENVGMSLNKLLAVERANCDTCILFDSDNVLNSDYLDAYSKQYQYKEVITCPDFAKPKFDYRRFGGWLINRNNVREFLSLSPMADCLLNTCNYVVNREEYLKIYQNNSTMKGTDTIWFNYLWLKSGRSFLVAPGMEYYHREHSGSGFMQDLEYNMEQSHNIKKLILEL